METKTMIDFIIDSAHDEDIREKFKQLIHDATSMEDYLKWFKNFRNGLYHVTDDECMRLYENKERMLKNPHIADLNVKGY
ncbi:MAG TPA: hypothetical protein PLM53_18330 [Spirochaetota bacterium]|nr:hypothetical protein [Spirochaetota bacterium]HPC42660.1 hypothetical protein [Spirochaetota bacterium]HPL16245.1 hypothetical protein [Spirochaetota bacterium]HQF08420.1 hypothetical protein [Spirochaetota bacterium]HQH99058.1 hypothetical protein [Spirochaetota bacterium]